MIESKEIAALYVLANGPYAGSRVSISGILRGMRVVTLDHTALSRIHHASDGAGTGTVDHPRALGG